jgi:hypothetical protein
LNIQIESAADIPVRTMIVAIEPMSKAVIHNPPPTHIAVAGSMVGAGVTRQIPLAIECH